jgi:hypothetical protein
MRSPALLQWFHEEKQMHHRMFRVGGALLAVTAAAQAQWSDDPNQNLAVSDRAGEQTQAKIHATSDGGAYISWFDNSSGGYDVYLQRLDAAGNEQWAHNGVLIADRTFSSTQDYDLDVDAADHALLAFRDTRLTGTQITATRVDPDGTQVWGATGVQLTSTTAYVAAPKIAAATDGTIVVAWTQDDATILQKLDVNGNPLWGPGASLTDPGGDSFSASDLDASDAGSVIISLVRGFMSPTYYAQKLSAAGAQLWAPSPIPIFDGGFLQLGNFPAFVPDGSGGAVFGWYGTGPLQCYVQRVQFNGRERFPHDGVAASTDLTQVRVAPDVSYWPATGETFLFWNELNSGQSQFGVYGQKFDVAGARQWSNTGKVLVPVGATERRQVRNLQFGDGALVFYVEGPSFGSQQVLGARVDTDGEFVWAGPMAVVSSAASSKSRLVTALTPDNSAALAAWIDTRNDAGDVYAQRINQDGSLGPPGIPGDIDGDGHVSVVDFLALLAAWGPCPDPCPPSCPADFDADCEVGVLDFLLQLANWG